MKNGRPQQLFPLLAAIGHPLARDPRTFEERFCLGLGHWRDRAGHRHWDARGASHLGELPRFIRPLVLHRRKQDCLELLCKRWRFHTITLSPGKAKIHEPTGRPSDRHVPAAGGKRTGATGRGVVGSTHRSAGDSVTPTLGERVSGRRVLAVAGYV